MKLYRIYGDELDKRKNGPYADIIISKEVLHKILCESHDWDRSLAVEIFIDIKDWPNYFIASGTISELKQEVPEYWL